MSFSYSVGSIIVPVGSDQYTVGVGIDDSSQNQAVVELHVKKNGEPLFFSEFTLIGKTSQPFDLSKGNVGLSGTISSDDYHVPSQFFFLVYSFTGALTVGGQVVASFQPQMIGIVPQVG